MEQMVESGSLSVQNKGRRLNVSMSRTNTPKVAGRQHMTHLTEP